MKNPNITTEFIEKRWSYLSTNNKTEKEWQMKKGFAFYKDQTFLEEPIQQNVSEQPFPSPIAIVDRLAFLKEKYLF